MARGPKKSLEDKIKEKEELIQGLKRRIKAEQEELDALSAEKRNQELAAISSLIEAAGIKPEQAVEILKEYVEECKEEQSA
ncbi:hypothetical protein D7X88_07850 [bacterium C-53]|nr:hypothetical protein [Lachnospiraceae bacterium]NBI02021.1 hypothetical protein [Lachnospiraceae bacterium]RKJ10290.1 hypothetical protein D7X88_07850 [bacterium C-53]